MIDKDDFINLTPEEKLRAENELMKLKLQAEFGLEKMDSSLGDETESEWLNYIYNWEKQFAEHKTIKVFDFLDKPSFIKAENLTQEEITGELKRLTEIMQFHGLDLGIICAYEEEIIYRFITEELFEHEMDDIRIEGMMHCFTYEEFHPNHDYDIRKNADEFIEMVIAKKWDDYLNNIMLNAEISYNNKLYDKKTFPEIIAAFQNNHQKITLVKWEIHSCFFNIETESGSIVGFINYISETTSEIFEGEGKLEFKLENDFWSISKVVIPGFSN